MKRLMINAFAVCLLTFVYVESFAQSKDEMKQLVSTMNQEMIDLVKAGRYEAMGKYYDKDAVSLPNYRAMEKGYKLILNNNLGRLKGGYKVTEGQKTTSELFLGEDMMVDIGQYSLTVTFPGLTEPKTDNGKYMNVWKKDADGAWRIVAETWNADRSPNPPAQGGHLKPGSAAGSNVKTSPGMGTQTGTEQKPVMDTKEGKK